MRALGVIMLATACGRIDFAPLQDAASPARRCSWQGAGPRIGVPQLRTDLSSPELDTDPLLVFGDPRTVYLTSSKPGTGNDIFVATRPSLDEPFGAPTPVVQTNGDEYAMQLDATGHGYYVSDAAGTPDIIEVQRTDAGIEVVRALDEVNDLNRQHDPHPSRDGLSLWFSEISAAGSTQDIKVARRPDPGSPWMTIEPFVYNTAFADAAPILSADELVVIWVSRITSTSTLDLFYATRSATSEPWGPPQPIAGLSSIDHNEAEPSLRDDGCELLFARAPASGIFDIYSVDIE